MEDQVQALTKAFYRWELRGRGWFGSDDFVMLEPAFESFPPPRLECWTGPAPRDDGKRPTFLGSLVERLSGSRPQPGLPVVPLVPRAYDTPVIDAPEREAFAAFDLRVPPGYVSRLDTGLELLRALRASEGPLAFELVGTRGEVHAQLVAGESDVPHLMASLEGYHPEVTLVPGPDRLIRASDEAKSLFVADFGLSEEFFLPLVEAKSFTLDPLISLVSALTLPHDDEFLCLQVLFEKVRNPWASTIREVVAGPDGTGIFEGADFLKAAMEKTATPLFAVAIRVAAQSETEQLARRLASKIEPFVSQFESVGGNRLIPLSNEHYDGRAHELALFLRQTHRAGMLLSARELSAIVHVPDASVRQQALVRDGVRTKAPPASPADPSLILGMNSHRGCLNEVRIGTSDRLAHTHVVGASGTGKSNFLLSSALADIESGHGVVVLDPHGDLIDDLLVRLPESRLADVLYFDPSEPSCPVGLNILAAETEMERDHLASDVVGMFQKLATSWGDSMGSVLANAVLAIVESKRGGTLLDLRQFLLDAETRKSYLSEIKDDEIRLFWEKSFPLIGTRSIGPILTRLDSFLRSKTIRRVVGVPRSTFDWADVLSGRRILLCKLSLGLLGEENASLLGSLVVSQLHQAALRRQQLERSERSPAFVYVDEFQHFVTPSMASLLSEGRKYGVGLVLAHQTLGQIAGNAVENAVMGNAHTRVVFRVSEGDAAKLASGFAFFEARDLLSLGRGQAIVRLGSADRDCNIETAPPVAAIRKRVPFAQPPGSPDTPSPVPERREMSEPAERSEPTEAPDSEPDLGPEPRQASDFLPVMVPKSRRWGQEHKYLAHLAARLGQERGFRATLEEQVAGGRVDVALRRDDVSVACEISVSTEVAHEIGNARKCLAASFQYVVIVARNDGKRARLQEALANEGLSQVIVQSPDELAVFLDSLGQPSPTEKLVRGYKVRVRRQPQSLEDATKRRERIGQIISRPTSSIDDE